MEKVRKLIWDHQALVKLEKALEWISETSVQQAEKVEQAILEKIEAIRVYPYHLTENEIRDINVPPSKAGAERVLS